MKEAQNQLSSFLEGLSSYMDYPLPERRHSPHHIVWQEGTTLLRDYGTHLDRSAPCVLFVPSLINRAYILDLSEQNSLIRFLTKEGIRCLLLDWQEPKEEEHPFGLEEYICIRLQHAIDTLYAQIGKPLILAGYCMGGLMALAGTLHTPQKVQGLALLATPWDFSCKDSPNLMALRAESTDVLREMFTLMDGVPAPLVYPLFYMMNPWAVHEKYRRFSAMPARSPQAQHFAEREQWLNDSVPLTRRVAQECFIDWAVHNVTGKGQWRIGNQRIRPEHIPVPAFCAIAEYDQIVPPACASALVGVLPDCTTLRIQSGHIGMIAGARAKEHLWLPLAKWLKNL